MAEGIPRTLADAWPDLRGGDIARVLVRAVDLGAGAMT